MVEKSVEFEVLLKEYKPMLHHLIHRLGIKDTHKEFFQEGLLALWEVSTTYEEDKGKLSSYVYYIVRNRLISLIRKKIRKQEQIDEILAKSNEDDLIDEDQIFKWDPYALQSIKGILTTNQWIWFEGFVVNDWSTKQIAERQNVSEDAVKNWGRHVKRKLKLNWNALDL